MGSMVTLAIHQATDLSFDDIDVLNDNLMIDSGFRELYDEFTSDAAFNGPFKYDGDTLQIASRWDGDFEGYSNQTMVWGCFGSIDAEVISKHIIAGKLILFMEIEGNYNIYYIIESGKVEEKNASLLQF